MAEVLVSMIMEHLASIDRLDKEVKLVTGVGDEVKKMTRKFRDFGAVLGEAERRQFKEPYVREWLERLKDTSFDIEDVLDGWKTIWNGKLHIEDLKPSRKVCSLAPCYGLCFRLFMRHDIGLKMKNLNCNLDNIAWEMNELNFCSRKDTIHRNQPQTTFIEDELNFRGRVKEKSELLSMLLNNSQGSTISIISIVGVAGVGKTSLVEVVFNDDDVKTHFEKRIWVCVSSPFDDKRITKPILESLGDLKIDLESVSEYIISQSPKKGKFLLVLDDVWTENDLENWKPLMDYLKRGSDGSRILVTTRETNLAESIGTTNMISLKTLPEKESRLLFEQVAFSKRNGDDRKQLENIGKKIVSKCRGLPLAIVTLGSLLCFKTDHKEWQNVLESETWELDEEKRGNFPSVILRYFNFSSTLRKCFSYCAIFPKESEIKKDILVKLWMGQGYIKQLGETKDLELIGEDYIADLANNSFFKEFKRNEFDKSIESFKMYDIVYDFAQFLTKNECFSQQIGDFEDSRVQFSCKRTRYLELGLGRGELFPMQIDDGKNIRSLMVRCDQNMKRVNLSKLFNDFKCLRTLTLSNCHLNVKQLPSEIKKLIHLRYLDLSRNLWLKELPEELGDLYNLQTLNISECMALTKLPQKIGKLLNLRHLVNDCNYHNLSHLPKGIERLTNLRTLKEFVVSRTRLGAEAAAGLECLKSVNNLRGSLDIFRLQNVANAKEAKSAELNKKENLRSLRLVFGGSTEGRNTNRIGIDEEVFNALEAPPNLLALGIYSYGGKTLPLNWMVSLEKLRELTLNNCLNWEYLPPLGQLRHLESLQISWMDKVKRVANHFLGIESDDLSVTVFPKLKTLTFLQMKSWEKWVIRMRGDEKFTIMPCLESLSISSCNELKSLPDHILQKPTLKKLEIDQCSDLKNLYQKDSGRKWSKISHIPDLKI